METLKLIEQRLARILEWVLVGLFGFFLILTVMIVVLRFGFNYGIIGSDELVRKSFLFTSAIGGAVGIARHEHIAITFFIDSMPRPIKMMFYVLGLALVALVNAAMIWYAWDWIATTGSFPWQPFNLPKSLVTSAIPIGCGLAVIFCVIKIILTVGGRENIDIVWLPED
ncbi:TRAP transporter small permease [Aliiroseovarius crassostreae]|uniref:TRAP transporter small permease n=1 Tax=Aliiroseovarius crassostreae TaxID=154981 RepID=UPI003C7DBB40